MGVPIISPLGWWVLTAGAVLGYNGFTAIQQQPRRKLSLEMTGTWNNKVQANNNGQRFEKRIEDAYFAKGYDIMNASKWLSKSVRERMDARRNNPFILLKNFPYSAGMPGRIEFFDVFRDVLIECKSQEVQGTAREKLWFTVDRLSQQPQRSILVYTGAMLHRDSQIMRELRANRDYVLAGRCLPADHVMILDAETFISRI